MVGKIVAGVAAKNLTPCILELGGKCPAVVHQTAELGHTTDKLCWAKFSNAGQTCVAPDYLFVHES
jgi:aldehyde dehydrogenase (NAD+)